MSTRLRLLTDCRTAFGADLPLPTAVLLDRLKADPEAPWPDYGPNGLTAMKLGTILRVYEIRSGNIRFLDGTQAKGYQRADFTDAWARYSRTPRTLAEKHIIQGLGARKLRDMSAEDVDKWLAE
ncbi:hypothetical protein BJ999_003502 [Actinomadura citrea]|uniref:DUF3631 domain-containing protein n=2 Tax=Actinomadura citrea TaxID=46158 RepID=A0A7Y9KDB7_9ACTN|nr:hypothetical protein [Actinomadura citrea]GGU04721.1 hypothetical protein GCM10010177_75010 [Actinomadura citrea]